MGNTEMKESRRRRAGTRKALWLLAAAAAVMTVLSLWKMADILREHVLSEQGYELLEVSEEKLQQGALVLVNRDNAWKGEGTGFVQVFANKTASYSVKDKTVYVHADIMQPLNDMMDAFYEATGSAQVIVTSGYRDEALQQSLYDASAAANGKDHADRFVAPAGHSEHHTGLAVDLGLYDTETGVYTDFDGTGDYAWFAENCADYGFILRYTREKESITGYADEPWHFRYVGLPHSVYITEEGLCLEEYIRLLQKHPCTGEPLSIRHDGQRWLVYCCEADRVHVPQEGTYTLSADNTGECIVTAVK